MKVKIIIPIFWDIREDSNDCLLNSITSIVNKQPKSKRTKQLLRGILLQKKPVQWDKLKALKLSEGGWFETKRDSDMERIAPLIGHFLRCRAKNFCESLVANFNNSRMWPNYLKYVVKLLNQQ